jgi:hypothetical protein
MTEPEHPQRRSRPVAIIELLDDGSIRLLPIVGSEDEIADILAVLKDKVRLDER